MRKVLITKRLYRVITTPVDVSLTVKNADGEPEKIRDTVLCYPFALEEGELLEITVEDNSMANYFDIRDGVVSYQTSPPDLNENGKWKREGRQIMKMSKFLNTLRNDFRCLDCQREKLINRAIELITTKSQKNDTNIMVSNYPGSIYRIKTADSNTGTLGTSCMRPESCHCGKEYVDNYNLVRGLRIAHMVNGDNLIARALLWHDVKDCRTGDKFKFMDRIYGNELNIEAFKEWAHENGYLHKVEQSYSNQTLIDADGVLKTSYYLEDAFSEHPENMPYVDTMCKYVEEENRLYCYDMDLDGEYYDLQNTDGSMELENDEDDEDYFYCYNCGCRTRIDDGYRSEDTDNLFCPDCAPEYLDHPFVRWSGVYENTMEVCINDSYYTVPTTWDASYFNLEWIESNDTYYYMDDVFCCDCCGENFHINDCNEHNDMNLCQSCYDSALENEKREEDKEAMELEGQLQTELA